MALQAQLPIFPNGTTEITATLGFKKESGVITYFNFLMPVFSHAEDDMASFRMITSQFCVNGYVSQMEIVRAFGVTKISVKRSVKLHREFGPKVFFAKRRTRGAAVLTSEVLKQVQLLLYEGQSAKEIASSLSLKFNTIEKAIRAGHLHKVSKKKT